ncbi:N-acetylmuramoyl-L-alanine amidase [Kitasatospora sp. NPDC087314]|uniref:N-acetylmuramoyl-L-alanine amidase n=1 Tax=Kitasatospora sp. NPDC087314 TaxID=3364068 RepID=UPI00381FE802
MRRGVRLWSVLLGTCAALLAPAVGTGWPVVASGADAGGRGRENLMQRQFASAAAEFGVPLGVLLALAYQESRWESHQGGASTTGNHGVLGLTDVDVAAVNARRAGRRSPAGEGDGTGGATRPGGAAAAPVGDSPALHTLRTAAELIRRPAEELKRDTAQNIRGGAALLAAYQRAVGGPAHADAGHWYRAVLLFGRGGAAGDGDEAAGRLLADRVYETLRTGAERTTSEGARMSLAAEPHLAVTGRPQQPPRRAGQPAAECPAGLGCDVAPAAYALTDPKDPTSYGNYNPTDRPANGLGIRQIVVHDTEGDYTAAVDSFQDPRERVSAHYLVRASDGQVTQLVATRDIAWHAGNKTVNMHSIGIEHEGFALPTDRPTWYSEQLYRSSAELVRYLAGRFGIPLDRAHVIGHEEVPAPTQEAVADMHWDPGPFWDWDHYLELLGATPPPGTGDLPRPGDTVAIATAAEEAGRLPAGGRDTEPRTVVHLRTGPSADAPLVNGGTTSPDDWTDTAVTGARYVVADRAGDWTAIWYDGRKCWFLDPGGVRTRTEPRSPSLSLPAGPSPSPSVGPVGRTVLTPRPGLDTIPVYGRAYPQASAYTPYPAVEAPPVVALQASVAAGQAYVAVDDTPQPADFFHQRTIDGEPPDDRILVVGSDTYYAIRFNHRLAFLRATDVRRVR